ncbi:MAG: DUF1549 domain-containing protein [Verrucomicrobiales bacterium]|nr:DUF1549 domain-containing protein [Verrucomicrobiales bacterium]
MPRFLQAVALLGAASLSSFAEATEGFAYFEEKVRPVLVAHCYECHSEEAGKRKGGLWLDRKEGWVHGGDAGPSLVPGDPEGSLLVESIRYADTDLQMPPKSRMSAEEVQILEQWVAMGAPDPRDEALVGAVRKEPIDFAKARTEWAYRDHQNPEVPPFDHSETARDPIDAFLRADWSKSGLTSAGKEDPVALVRRLHYDLTGLPPTVAEVEAFASNPDADAYEAIVDELLSRPGFGEKWGRHWLDVVRYADSNGGDRNFTFYQAWRYRNWVIDAFNRDVSYYDFIRNQLAGDLLPAESPEKEREQIIAATFLSLGPKMLTERDKEKLWMDTADEQLDTVGRAFLGLTLGCARCHDHKFDPVSQEDYYAMAGIFRSTEVVSGTRNGCVNVASWIERPLPVADGDGKETREMVERLELAMRLTVEKSFMKKAGGKETSLDLPLAGVIYDESDAELVGTWITSKLSPNRFGAGYIHDDQKGKGENRAIFRGSLPESGEYEVRVAYSSETNRASNVPVTVLAADGKHEVVLDETKRPSVGGLFEPIGRFHFEKGADCEVTINTGKTGARYVIVDAVQFIAVKDIPREAKAIAAIEDDGVDPLLRMSESELKKELGRLIGELKNAEVAMAPRDARDADDCHLRVRGDVSQKGALIPRNFLQVLHEGEPPQIEEGASGRVELADWIVIDNNALLDRVIVNRLWHHLFGRGIVATVDNFGRLGSGATHPDLLEHLASSFRESGGSMKGLIRRLVLSEAYQLSSSTTDEMMVADPANEHFARQNRRRLSAEEIRDSILFVSGELDREPGMATANRFGIDLDKPMLFAKEKKRTVYLPVARNNPATELAIFDAANPDLVSGRRSQTTVPTQALYLLNSEFLHARAAALGKMAMAAADKPGSEVEWLYLTLLGRAPYPLESQRAMGLIADLSGGAEDRAALEVAAGHLAHVLLASSEFLFLE